MAVNETIVTGRYFRRCTDAANKVWQRISFWHKASDCEFDDNKNAQTKVGAIKGITTSTSVTETGYAADMTTVKNLQTQIDELNSNLNSSKTYSVTIPWVFKASFDARAEGGYYIIGSAAVNGKFFYNKRNVGTKIEASGNMTLTISIDQNGNIAIS